MKAPQIYNPETDEFEPLPFKWEICWSCDGHGKSSAYLGAFTKRDLDEDPDFAQDYFAGAYDRACDCCGGSGKMKVADEEKMTEAQQKAWQEQIEFENEQRAEKLAEYRCTSDYWSDIRGGH